MRVLDWWRLARAEHAFLVAFAVLVAQWFVGFPGAALALAIAVPPFLVTLASFIFNDWADEPSDRANKRRDRPLVSGAIGRPAALYAALALYALAVLLALLLPPAAFLVLAAFALASLLYSVWLKKLPLVGNAFIASSMGVSFVYANVALSPLLRFDLVLWALIAFLVGLGRELLITLRDVKGDRKVGATTLPMVVGARNTVRLSTIFLFAAVFLSFYPLLARVSLPYLALVLITDALLLRTVLAARNPTLENLKRARNWTLYALGTGLLAFASLAL